MPVEKKLNLHMRKIKLTSIFHSAKDKSQKVEKVVLCCAVLSCSVMSNSLQPRGL